MTAKINKQSVARRRAGRRLMEVIKKYNLNLRTVARETGVDLVTLENLKTFTPHLNTIERVSVYLEQIARLRQAKSNKEKTKARNLAKAKAQQEVLIARRIAALNRVDSASVSKACPKKAVEP